MNPDMLLRRSEAEVQWLKEQFSFIASFWDKDEESRSLNEVERDRHTFAEQVYLAMDWPTFPGVRCL